ncbi:metallophosphoesterase [Virgibacillus kimchii]
MIHTEYIELDKTKRIIVISDIHGSLKLFRRLLEKVNYTKDDYLFINGDLCEKGKNSLETVEFVQKLTEQSAKVFVTKGNCDVLFRHVFNGNEGIIPYMKKREHSILNEMLQNQEKSVDDFSSLEEIAAHYRTHYHKEIQWLESLPIAFETDEHIIIHAGIEHRKDWKQTGEMSALQMQAFYEKGHQADKTVIVGHWPVVNYRSNIISSHNPLIDKEKRMIALDGGNQIKKEGQLNALIIENGNYDFAYVDELTDERIVLKDYIDTTNSAGTVTYPNYEMRKIKEDKYFTLCENRKLGLRQWVKNEYLITENDVTWCRNDLSTTFLSVEKGDHVWVVDDACEGFTLIKKADGEIGWVPKKVFV